MKIGTQIFELPKNFRKFNPKRDLEDVPYFSCIIYGKRRSGKSTILRDLLYNTRKNFDEIYSFSETSHMQPDLFTYVPKDHQRKGFDIAFLEKLMQLQEDDVLHKLENKQENKIKKLCFIFDDVINDSKIRHSESFNKLFVSGRHLRSSVIVLTQEIGGRNGLPPVARNNCDLILGFYAQNAYDRELLVERYLSLQHKKIGDKILQDITMEPFQCIAVLNKKIAYNYEDYVYTYKCDPKDVPKFTIGTKSKDLALEHFSVKNEKGNSLFRIEFMTQQEDGLESVPL